MQSNFLARQTSNIGRVVPRGLLIDGIAEQLIRVGEREAGDGRTSRVLKFDSQAAGRRRGVVH